MLPNDFERQTRAYVSRALPHAPLSEKEKLVNDWLTKETAAEGIVADFVKRAGDPRGKSVLEVGFGNGITLATFAKHGAHLSGLELSPELLGIATEYLRHENITADIRLYDGVAFPFPNSSFDYIYSISVLEHVSHPTAVLKEMCRVLKPEGKLYLAFPNRFSPRETHTGLWLISYLPRSLARTLLAFFRRNTIDDWNLHFLDYFWLQRLLYRESISLVVEFETSSPSIMKRLVKKLLAIFRIHHSALLPHVMVILTKRT